MKRDLTAAAKILLEAGWSFSEIKAVLAEEYVTGRLLQPGEPFRPKDSVPAHLKPLGPFEMTPPVRLFGEESGAITFPLKGTIEWDQETTKLARMSAERKAAESNLVGVTLRTAEPSPTSLKDVVPSAAELASITAMVGYLYRPLLGSHR